MFIIGDGGVALNLTLLIIYTNKYKHQSQIGWTVDKRSDVRHGAVTRNPFIIQSLVE